MRRPTLIAVATIFCLASAPAWASKVYMSLMGEPFWTNDAGEAPFDQWWKLADEDGDGAISRREFRTDAEAFFASLDTTHDKIIDADEMAVYEQSAPGRTRAAGGGAEQASSSRPKPKSSAPVEEGQVAIVSSGNVPSATRIHPGGGAIDFSSVPQPVAMADRNIDRRVTLDEFIDTADRRFANYDVDQDGRLSRKELR
jgi:hypothetical protein